MGRVFGIVGLALLYCAASVTGDQPLSAIVAFGVPGLALMTLGASWGTIRQAYRERRRRHAAYRSRIGRNPARRRSDRT